MELKEKTIKPIGIMEKSELLHYHLCLLKTLIIGRDIVGGILT